MPRRRHIIFECAKGLVVGAMLSYAIMRLLLQDPDVQIFRYAGY